MSADGQAGFSIRAATNADADRIRAVVFGALEEYGLAPDPIGTDADLDDVEGNYARRGGLFEVVEDGEGTIVGTVGLRPLGDGVCELRKMYLARAARGRGVGKLLLERALDRARALGFRRVELETASALIEAIRLYESRGFRPVPVGGDLAPRCDQRFALDLERTD